MPRANASVPPEAIRIEDEVWEEAFTRREPANRRSRLRAIDGGGQDELWTEPRREARPRRELAERPRQRREPSAPATAAEAVTADPGTRSDDLELSAATWLGSSTSADRPPRPWETSTAPPVRRTVKIEGRGAERNMPLRDPAHRRPTRRPYERHGFRPDRLAMWAVILGFVLVFVAIASGHS